MFHKNLQEIQNIHKNSLEAKKHENVQTCSLSLVKLKIERSGKLCYVLNKYLNLAKGALPAFSASFKGVVKQSFPWVTPWVPSLFRCWIPCWVLRGESGTIFVVTQLSSTIPFKNWQIEAVQVQSRIGTDFNTIE